MIKSYACEEHTALLVTCTGLQLACQRVVSEPKSLGGGEQPPKRADVAPKAT